MLLFYIYKYPFLIYDPARDSCNKWQEIINKVSMISWVGQLKISRHFFVFVFFCKPLTYYLARDSCKRWQEIIDKLGLISWVGQLKNFSSLFCFFFFFLIGESGSLEIIGQLKISRHYFFLFFSFEYYFGNWTETAENFSSLFLFFLSFF